VYTCIAYFHFHQYKPTSYKCLSIKKYKDFILTIKKKK